MTFDDINCAISSTKRKYVTCCHTMSQNSATLGGRVVGGRDPPIPILFIYKINN